MPVDRTLQFRIFGMDCAEEINALKSEVGPLVGGEDCLAFDLLSGRMTIRLAKATVDEQGIFRAVSHAGMRAVPWSDDTSSAERQQVKWWRKPQTLLTIACGFFTIAGMFWDAVVAAQPDMFHSFSHLDPIPFGLGIVAGSCLVIPKAVRATIRLQPDMNLLMTIAVVGAVAIDQWEEASTVSFLFALSIALESWSIGRARRAITALMDLTPPTARLVQGDGTAKLVPVGQVPPGARVVVKPGERIPLDGKVLAGTTYVNQAPITGESVPVEKSSGDEVFAGTINGNGAIEIENLKPADQTTLAHIVRLIEQAQSRRSPSEQWVDQFARVYTPTVLGLSLLIFILPPILLGQSWSDWFYRSLVLLVIGCPCALVISTPVSIVAALASAARHGVLVKGGVFLEIPSRLQAIAFDKTGTLTKGQPTVQSVIPLSGHNEQELLERAAGLEIHSQHPLGQAIVQFARSRNCPIQPAEEYQEIPGKGAVGHWNGKPYWLGSHRLLEERNQETEAIHDQLQSLAAAGSTVVIFGNAEHVCGFIALKDAVRSTAKEAIQRLHEMDVRHTTLLTGDNRLTAEAVAAEVGVEDVQAELLPAEKVKAVELLVQKYGIVAMVGDGVNDAPALATASLGIAMGVAGSDTAIETADITLMTNDLTRLPWIVSLSRRTLKTIRQNIAFSLGVKGVFVVLTVVGHASLWAAIAADTGVSLLVILNGLRLLQSGTAISPISTDAT